MSSSHSGSSSEVGTPEANVDSQLALEQALRIAGWPASLLHEEKQARAVQTVEEFTRVLLYGDHTDEIIVLRDGLSKLQQHDAIPADIMRATLEQPDLRSFLHALPTETLQQLRGRVFTTAPGSRDEVELRDGPKGESLETMCDKRRALEAVDGKHSAYLCELRRGQKCAPDSPLQRSGGVTAV